MAKTDAEVANINARSAISTARTTRNIVLQLRKVAEGQLEMGTIESAVNRAWSVGWTAGANDAMGE